MKKNILLLTVSIFSLFASCTKFETTSEPEVFVQPTSTVERSSICPEYDNYPGFYAVYLKPTRTGFLPSAISITVSGTAPNSTSFTTTVSCATNAYNEIVIPRTSSPDLGWTLTFSTTSTLTWQINLCQFGWNKAINFGLSSASTAIPYFVPVSTPDGYCLDVTGGEYITQPWCAATVYAKIVKSNGTGYAQVTAGVSTNLTDNCGGATLSSFGVRVYDYTANGTYIDRFTFTPLLDQDIYGMPQGATDLRVSLHGTNGQLSDPDDPENMCTVTGWIQAGNASTQYFNMYINDPAFGWETLNEYNVGGCDY